MNYLEKKLKEKHISKQELAIRLGVNKNTITNYCKKANFGRISADRLCAMANILGISYDELVYEVLGQKRIIVEKVNMNKEPENYVDIIRKIKHDNITDIVVTRKAYIEELVNLIDRQDKGINKLINYIAVRENKDYEEVRKEFDIWVIWRN